jgi:hypothetical protein
MHVEVTLQNSNHNDQSQNCHQTNSKLPILIILQIMTTVNFLNKTTSAGKMLIFTCTFLCVFSSQKDYNQDRKLEFHFNNVKKNIWA